MYHVINHNGSPCVCTAVPEGKRVHESAMKYKGLSVSLHPVRLMGDPYTVTEFTGRVLACIAAGTYPLMPTPRGMMRPGVGDMPEMVLDMQANMLAVMYDYYAANKKFDFSLLKLRVEIFYGKDFVEWAKAQCIEYHNSQTANVQLN